MVESGLPCVNKKQFFPGVFFLKFWREPWRNLCKQPISEYFCLSAHLPHVNRRAEDEGISLFQCVIKLLHVIADYTPIALDAAQTTLAWLDLKIAKRPDLSFGPLIFCAFEYFVDHPRCVTFFPRTSDKSDDFHLFSL
jgi:hypothetical protein